MSIHKDILSFLKKYSSDVSETNRLITTAFCIENRITITNNRFLEQMHISERNVSEYLALEKFCNLFKEFSQTFDFECLIELYEFVISPSDKIINGAVYTPKYIRKYIVESSIANDNQLDMATACDVACGCGGFLYEYALVLHEKTGKSFKAIIEENLFGIDVTDYSIERTKILLTLLALVSGEDEKEIKFNLFVGDSLEFDWFEKSAIINARNGFDYIFSNPPYVGSSNLDERTKDLMKNWSVTSTGKMDLYIPFFEIGTKWLVEGGTMGYITVNNFYRSLNGRALRSYFSKNSFEFKLIDFGSEQVFKSRLTYTCICIISKLGGNLSYTSSTPQNIHLLRDQDFISFEFSDLNDLDGWQLDDAKTQLNIMRLENSGDRLGDLYSIRNGFATLRNHVYLFVPTRENDTYYFFEKDDREFQVERAICRDAIKPNVLKDEVEIPELTEKLIFPYTIAEEANEDLFQQNLNRTVNIIPSDDFERQYPFACGYLREYENELAERDKGQRDYETWFAFGRSQALNIPGLKLLFPYISNRPYFVFTDNEELLFYNGYAVVSDNEEDLRFVQRILKTNVFWYYIKHTSKPYANNYFALAKNYVKNFSIPEFTPAERRRVMNYTRQKSLENFLLKKYNITDIDF